MGKTLGELLGWEGPMTHLEFLVWHRWLDERWNDPDLHCYYMMQIAAEIRLIRNSFSKRPPGVRLAQFKIPFTNKREESKPLSEAEGKRLEAIWASRLGLVGPAARQARQKREPGLEHARARGITPNASSVSTPRGKRGNPPRPIAKPQGQARSSQPSPRKK